MPGDIKVGPNKCVSMTTDFGHSPIGRLGGRKVEVGQGQRPRLKFGPIHEGMGWRARVANAMTTAGRRTESKVLAGLEDFGKCVGNTLGSLIPRENGKPDLKQLLKDLESLRKEAVPLTKRGADYQELLKARVGMELSRFSEKGLKNLLASFQTRSMQRFLTGLSRDADPNVVQALDILGRGDSLLAKVENHKAMARDLETIFNLVGQEVDRRAGKSLNTFVRSAQGFLRAPIDPGKHPGRYAGQVMKTHRSLQELKAHAESMGVELPKEVRDLERSFKRQLSNDQLDSLVAIQDFLENPGKGSKGFSRRLDQAMNRMRIIEQVAEGTGREMPTNLPELRDAVGRMLVWLKPEDLDLDGLRPRDLNHLRNNLHAFDLHGLDKALDRQSELLFRNVRQAFAEALAPCLQALESRDPHRVARAVSLLSALGAQCQKVFEDLGGRYEGEEGPDGLLKNILQETLAGMDAKDLVAVAQSLRSGEMIHFADLILAVSPEVKKGLDDSGSLERMVGKTLLKAGNTLKDLDSLVEQRLARDGIPMPDRVEDGLGPMMNIPREAMDALRESFGVTRTSMNAWTLTGTMGPVPDRLSTRVSTGVERCLDSLAGGAFRPDRLVVTAFEINTRLGQRHPEIRDPGEARAFLKGKMLETLTRTPNEMLQRLHSRLTSESVMNLRHGLSTAMESGPENMEPLETDTRSGLASVAFTLDTLEEALAQVLTERNLPFSPPPEGTGEGPLTQENRNVFDVGLTQIGGWLSTPEHLEGQGSFQDRNLEIFRERFAGYPSGGQLLDEEQNRQGQGLGVCKAFHKDFDRAHFSLEENGQTRTLFEEGRTGEEKFQNGKEELLKLCGNDPALVFRVTQFINQSAFEPSFTAMSLRNPESPLTLPDGRKPSPMFLGNRVEYTLSKGQDGGINLHLKTTFPTHGLMMEKEDFSNPEEMPMDINTSRMVLNLDLTIGRDGRFSVRNEGYEFELNRSVNLTLEE